MKRWLIATGGGLLVLTLVLTGIGSAVFAQNDTTTPAAEEELDPRDAYLETLAAELGVTVDELETAMTDAELQMIDRWAEEARDRVAEGGSLFPGMHGPFSDSGRDGPRIRIHGGGMIGPEITMILGREGPGEGVANMATFLGISEDDLRADFQSGLSLVEVAESYGKTYDDLRAYLIEQATERIDERLQEPASETGESEDTTGTPETSL